MHNTPVNVGLLHGFSLTQIVSGSQALPQREPRSRRSEGTSGGSGSSSSGGTNRQIQQYNNKDFSKKGGGSGTSGGGMGGSSSGSPMSGRGGGETLPDAWQLFVGGLPPQTSDADIRSVFEREGTVLDVRVNPKNFAFVIFNGPDPVQKIMSNKDQYQLNGRRLNIELKRPSAMRYGGPRSGGGDRGGDRDRGDRPRPPGGLGGGGGAGGGGGFGGKPRSKGGKR